MQPLHMLCRRIGNFVLLFGAMPDLHYINGPVSYTHLRAHET